VPGGLSPGMVDVARALSSGFTNIEYHVTDAAAWDYPAEAFDAVVSIATLHHLPLEPSLAAFERTLRPGGVLLVLDLLDRSNPAYLPLNALALLSRGIHRIRGVERQSAELRRAYQDHGAHDRLPAPPRGPHAVRPPAPRRARHAPLALALLGRLAEARARATHVAGTEKGTPTVRARLSRCRKGPRPSDDEAPPRRTGAGLVVCGSRAAYRTITQPYMLALKKCVLTAQITR
jgi:SAM-dependent methyltransferase